MPAIKSAHPRPGQLGPDLARILVLGGFAESLLNFRGALFQEMVKLGHEVIACAPHASADVRTGLAHIGVDYRHVDIDRTGTNPFHDFSLVLRMVSLFRMLKPEIFLAYTIKPVIYGSVAARITGVPMTFSLISGLGFSFVDVGGVKRRLVNRLVRRLYRLALRKNHCVLFQNADDMHEFTQLGLVERNQSVVIPGSGVDINRFGYTAPAMAPVFLLIARLLRDKGITEYVEAAKELKRRYPEARFLLLGWTDENPAAISRQEVDAWVREGVIEYLGRHDDVRPYIAGASVYVLPSYREGLPRTVLEAMAMGRPIVTTDVPGCRETVIQGKNGYLVPPHDASALAQAMEKFILHPEIVPGMGRESRKIAEDRFDVHKVNWAILQAMGLA